MNNKPASPKVFIIVLNYNGLDTLNNCLTSVFQSNYNNFEVVVVDNDSKDGSLEKARNHFSRAHFIKNSANVGFAQGNNVGIRFALEKFADAVLVLNNDAIIEAGTLTTLMKASKENPQSGILSPVIHQENNEVWFAGGNIDWKKMKTNHETNIVSAMPYATQYITGCSMLVKKEVFKKIGLFDERYFLYYEDADFSLRAARAGFELLVVPNANIVHLEKSSSNNSSKTYWLVLSGIIFFLTNSTFFQKIWLRPYLLARKLKNLYDLLFYPSPLVKDVRKAYRDYSHINLK